MDVIKHFENECDGENLKYIRTVLTCPLRENLKLRLIGILLPNLPHLVLLVQAYQITAQFQVNLK